MSNPIRIDVFSDPACPWCLVGLHRLDAALADLPEGTEIDVAHHPYLLDPSAKPEGEDIVEVLTRKYGRDPHEAWARIEAEAAKDGVALDMTKQKWRYATQGAQALIAAAAEKGVQHKLALAMSDAYYLEACNIADPEALADIAENFGFSREEAILIVTDTDLHAEITAAAQAAAEQGIQGVPFFIFAQKYALSGAQPAAVFAEALQTVLREKAA